LILGVKPLDQNWPAEIVLIHDDCVQGDGGWRVYVILLRWLASCWGVEWRTVCIWPCDSWDI